MKHSTLIHSKSNWRITESIVKKGKYYISDSELFGVADIINQVDFLIDKKNKQHLIDAKNTTLANARLICAAPLLLAALIECVERVEIDMGSDNPRVIRAKEAIKLATL